MQKSTVFAVLAFMCIALLIVTDAKPRRARKDDVCDRRNHTCTYPDMCTSCPPKIVTGYIRKPIFFFDKDTQQCEEDTGTSDSCNSFGSYEDCAHLCGVDSSEEE
ncbi:uncharacterized protein LOC142564720 [Dermacentor variabilis]|uniref:uncharacterized protein LOC142564720 n=1 Tax=Dermacentor variabilis TaxID=34621 RepID=UPI003F5BC4F4